MTRHKHADLMIAYANDTSLDIQSKHDVTGIWYCISGKPIWNEDLEYRIKPKAKKTVTKWMWIIETATGDHYLDGRFYSEQEIVRSGVGSKPYRRIEWSKTEFEVK